MAQEIEEKACGINFKEAVCINTNRIYDSCCDKDCLQDMQVYFPQTEQAAIDEAVNVRSKEVDIMNVFIDVTPLPFNRGYYTVDMTFFFDVKLSAFSSPYAQPTDVEGVATFTKRSILFGSEGNVKIYSSDSNREKIGAATTNMPKATVQIKGCKQTKTVTCFILFYFRR